MVYKKLVHFHSDALPDPEKYLKDACTLLFVKSIFVFSNHH